MHVNNPYSLQISKFSTHGIIHSLITSSGLILDVGCNDGYFARIAAGPSCKFYGIDNSLASIRKASKYCVHASVLDLNKTTTLPWRFKADCIVFADILEHLHDKTKIMGEIHRVLAHGGWAFIEIPSTDGRGAFQDPTHVSYWNENSFLYYTDKYLADFIDNDTIRFQEFRRETYFPNEWMQNMGVLVTTAWLVANKDKGARVPHLLKI